MKYLNRLPLTSLDSRAALRRAARASTRAARPCREERGAELVEYALVLPLLLVLLVGLLDFAMAYHIKQKLSNAAREGARLGASQGIIDITQTNPPSVQAINDTVVAYLTDAGVNTSFIGSTMQPAGGFTWTYYSAGSYGLRVQRIVNVPISGGGTKSATQVTLTYPYNWTFGFNNIIKLLIPSANVGAPISIPADAIMVNL